MYLGYFHPSESHAVHPYPSPLLLFQYGYAPQVPMSPMDLAYSLLMLPANLLSGAPSPYTSRQSYFQQLPQPALPLYHPRMHSVHLAQPYHKASPLPGHPYLTQPTTNTSLDQLNLSRTVIMKNLSADLSLNDLLSEIEYGPIEYCKMFETAAPAHFPDVEKVKTCYISFVNTQVLVSFHSKYGKNTYNLRLLRERLKNSKYLKISLNEPHHPGNMGSSNLSKQDFIKLKTLNYIMEFNATRAVKVLFTVTDPESKLTLKDDFYARCAKYGEIEDFQTISNDENPEEVSFVLHFTSIDSAIKIYEYHLKRIQIDHLNLLDLEENDVLPTMCTAVAFHKDRCDRTELNKTRRSAPNSNFSKVASSSSSSSVASSPTSSRKPMTRHFQSGENYKFSSDTARSNEKSASPLHSTSIQEEDDAEDDLPTASADVSAESKELESFQPPGPQNELSPSLKAKSSLDNSSSGAFNSSIAGSEFTDLSHSRSRRHIGNSSDPYLYGHQSLMHQPSMSSIASMGLPNNYQYNPDPFNVGNRTLYLGNLHPSTTVEEIANNVRAGGLVESIKYHKLKKVCFITFIDPAIALKFFLNHQVLHQLIIHGNEVNVCWGKNHSGQLSRDIALAVTAGASRNVYIGLKPGKNSTKEENIELPDEETLREDFGRFGEMEQINFYNHKDCGFINFMNIAAAIKVVEMFESKDPKNAAVVAKDNGEFYEKYKNFKISFGKDRCGNPPKFSFKKKNSSFDFLRDRDLVDMPVPRADTLHSDKDIEPMNNEAAMVFGISTEPVDSPDEKLSPPTEYLAESTVLVGANTEEKQEQTSSNEDDISSDAQLKLTIENVAMALKEHPTDESSDLDAGADNEFKKDEEEEVEEEDDEDDISIIIGSDTTAGSPHKKSQKKHQRLYHHHSFLNDGMNSNWATSRNSSALSLNSSYATHYNYHPSSFSPVPAIPQPVMYHQAPQFMPQMRQVSYYGIPQMAPMPQPQLYHHSSFPGPNMGMHKSPYTVSGSQVMAQYLAKSQHDNYLYATSILNNDITSEEIREYKKSSRRSSKKN
ncbi:CIC11C00000002132 [Sungouiella intermedia]|uniref:CIC11C00000002132 n=1 Tax=Sungouiella intermedia TaxID=45354 RepID=A0A1L0BRI4_9ASCO|nr:CIC11C00000002132 [[Candida] intermedia]